MDGRTDGRTQTEFQADILMFDLCGTQSPQISSHKNWYWPWHWLPPGTPNCKWVNERMFPQPWKQKEFYAIIQNLFERHLRQPKRIYSQFDSAPHSLPHTPRQNLLSGAADLQTKVTLSDNQITIRWGKIRINWFAQERHYQIARVWYIYGCMQSVWHTGIRYFLLNCVTLSYHWRVVVFWDSSAAVWYIWHSMISWPSVPDRNHLMCNVEDGMLKRCNSSVDFVTKEWSMWQQW